MMVTLLVTVIVVFMAFAVLTLVQKHMAGISDNLSESGELEQLKLSLWVDFNKYEKIVYSDGQLGFKGTIDSVTYQMSDSMIVKDIDTFTIKQPKFSCYFNGEEVQQGKIDALRVETDKDRSFFVFKNNDAYQYME